MNLISRNSHEISIDDKLRSWTTYGESSRIWVSGSAERNAKWLTGDAFAFELANNEWKSGFLDSLNGCWAAIRADQSKIELAVDRSRSIPLLYWYDGQKVIVANAESELRKQVKLELDETNCLEFLLSTFVTCGHTLFKNTFHVQPGEKLTFRKTGSGWDKESENTFHFFPTQPEPVNEQVAKECLLDAVDCSFETLQKRLDSRRALLPISGGLDSRLIAYYLKKHSVENVVCYTYGSPKNPQNKIAECVAKDLGFEWIFVPYDRKVWADAVASEEASSYWDYSCNGIASPHMQDFPALLSLSKRFNGLSDFVLLPGHVGDAWASEFIVKDLAEPYPHGPAKYHSDFFQLRNSPILSAIIYRYYNLWPTQKDDWAGDAFTAILDRISRQLNDLAKDSSQDPRYLLTEWVLRARTSQWITNACRSAEFFGADFALPLADYRLIDLFRRLSVEQLYRRNLYSETISNFLSQTEYETLNQIKIMSGVRPPVTWKKMTIGLLKAVGVYQFLDRYRRLYREDTSLNSDAWFTSEKSPELTTISTALESYGLSTRLPSLLYDVIRPYQAKTVHSIECNGLLAAAILSRYFQQQNDTV